MIIDAHWDTALHLLRHNSLESVAEAHCDWQRLRQFVDIAFMAIFVHPLEYRGEEQYRQFYMLVHKLLADIGTGEHGVTLLRQAAQLEQPQQGKLVLLGAEGGGFLGQEQAAERLREAFNVGLRLLGLTWNQSNALAGGCAESGGLTETGRQMVRLCNEWGIVVDGAHLNAQSLKDVLSICAKPMVVSHTACAALCPEWKVRNLLDWQLQAVRDNGGVVGICFVPQFIGGQPSLRRVAEHMAYAAELIGVEHVGLGSDLDGTELPPDVQGLQSLPQLETELAVCGFNKAEIALIMGGNFQRLLRQLLP